MELDRTCSVTNFLANGIPDYQVNGGWRDFIIAGSTTTFINQQNTQNGKNYRVGTYSHTTDGVSQCSKQYSMSRIRIRFPKKSAYPYTTYTKMFFVVN